MKLLYRIVVIVLVLSGGSTAENQGDIKTHVKNIQNENQCSQEERQVSEEITPQKVPCI